MGISVPADALALLGARTSHFPDIFTRIFFNENIGILLRFH